MLQVLAQLMQQQCRDRDLVARYGGEEFVLLFNGIGLADAQAMCDRVRRAVQDHDWSQVAAGLVVTASMRLTELAATTTAAQALTRADELLHQAKAAGCDGVVTG